MTLQEAKDKIAKEHNHETWNQMVIYLLQTSAGAWEMALGRLEQASEIYAQSCTQEAISRIEELEGALEDAINGLQWRIDNNPEIMDKSDYEKLDEWNNLLKLKEKK